MIAFVPQAAAGLLMEQELKYLGMATTNPRAPLRRDPGRRQGFRQDRSDRRISARWSTRLLIGGAMAYTFLKAQGLPTGKSLVEDDKIDLAQAAAGRHSATN